MKKKITTLFLLALGATTYAQDGLGVGIGTTVPNQAAMLDVSSTNKGVLIPRLPIADLQKFGLNGEAVEGVLVYNNTAKAAGTAPVTEEIKVGFHYWKGGKWELITSQTQLDTAISNVTNEFNTKIDNINTKIDNIIDGGGNVKPEDKSYMVVFKPEIGPAANPAKGELQYLIPVKGADGLVTYTKQTISFGELVQGAETETFIAAADATGKTVADMKDAKMFVYYGEKAVRDWSAKAENAGKVAKTDMVLSDGGIKVDVVGAVTTNFQDIVNNTENKTFLETFISSTPGGLTIDVPNGQFIVKKSDGKGGVTEEQIPFVEVNILTTINGFEDKDGDGLKGKAAITALPGTKEKGTVVYEYVDEKGVKTYINITADVINSVTNNENLKKEIFKTVNEYTTINGGGNVYFGFYNDPALPGEKPVLFTMDADKNKTKIDISQNIITEITDSKEVKETINNLIKVEVTDKPAYTHQLINTKAVLKVTAAAEVVGATPEGATAAVDYNSTFSKEVDAPNFVKLVSVQVFNGDNLVTTSVTDVKKEGNGVKFNFGVGKMYQVLPKGTNYTVVMEYISSLDEAAALKLNEKPKP